MNKKLALILMILSIGACRIPENNSGEDTKSEEKEQSTEKQEVKSSKKSQIIKSAGAAVSETNKEEIKVTFVELGSVGCIPCKMMQPVMDEIEKEYAGQVKVIFYDVWKPAGRPYAQKYSIKAIPTQVFLDKNGNEYYRHTGYFPKEELVKILKMQGVK
ncbi:MAG: thioredoxin family protein [bacterium]